MLSLVTPLMQRSAVVGYVSLLLLGGIIGIFLFLRKATNAERDRQRVTPEQLALPVAKWVNVRSRIRRRRVLSQLPPPSEDGLPGEQFIRVSGQSRAALVLSLTVPGLLIVFLVAALIAVNVFDPSGLTRQFKTSPLRYVHHAHRHRHKKHPGDLLGSYSFHAPSWDFYQGLLTVLLLIGIVAVLAWVVYVIAQWGGVYFVLSDYRFRRIWIYPLWMFWKTVIPEEVELHMLTSKGYDQKLIGKMFGFGWLKLDTAGTADDALFNLIPWVPDVASFETEIANAQRAAVPPVIRTQGDLQLEKLDEIHGGIKEMVGLAHAYFGQIPTQAASPSTGLSDDTRDFPELSQDTGKIPPVSDEPKD